MAINKLFNVILFASLFFSINVFADVAPSNFRQLKSDKVWEEKLRKAYFNDKKIIEDTDNSLIQIKAPYAAEDATIVPISIRTHIPQTKNSFIKKMHIFIDKNPLPLVGVFEFSPKNGKADLAMRVRVDTFSYIRLVAELNTGELYMTKSFVRAKGACSSPPPKGAQESKLLLGKMKIKSIGDIVFGKPNLIQLKIRHPNITGMAPLKIGSRVIPPPHYIDELKIYYNDELVMQASTTFGVSMDPAYRFYIVPDKEGTLTVKGKDTKKNMFTSSYKIKL